MRTNIAIIVSFFLMFSCTGGKTANQGTKEISADLYAVNPDLYPGYIGLTGTIKEIDNSNHFFGLGCQDACILIPVKYYGTMPQMNSNIVVYGVLTNENGRYFFDGKEVKYR